MIGMYNSIMLCYGAWKLWRMCVCILCTAYHGSRPGLTVKLVIMMEYFYMKFFHKNIYDMNMAIVTPICNHSSTTWNLFKNGSNNIYISPSFHYIKRYQHFSELFECYQLSKLQFALVLHLFK